MKNSKTFVKTLALALLAGLGLSGCVAVPYGGSPYGYGQEGGYYGPPAYSAPLIVPSISLGLDFGRGGRHRHHRGHR